MSADFITLSCPTCGAKLQITQDTDRFACGHCGHEHIVRRQGGIVSLAPVMERLDRIESGTNRTAAEMAIARLTREIRELEVEVKKLQEMTNPTYSKSSIALFFIGVIILAWLGMGSLSRGDGLWALFWCVVGLSMTIYSIAKESLKGRRFRIWQRQELQKIDDEIAHRHERLRVNRELAEGE